MGELAHPFQERVIQVTKHIHIDDSEIKFQFVRASGPGGQKLNKVATAAKLRFDVVRSPSLPDAVRERLIRMAGKRISRDGILVIDARRYRTQDRNRQDATQRLVRWIQRAAKVPKPRRKTRPSPAAKKRRLDEKRHRGQIKRLRGSLNSER